jgi:hypothetical protein
MSGEEETGFTLDFSDATSAPTVTKRRKRDRESKKRPPKVTTTTHKRRKALWEREEEGTGEGEGKEEKKRTTTERSRRADEEKKVEEEEGKEEKKARRDTAVDKACVAELLESAARGAGGGEGELKEAPEWVPAPLDGIDWAAVDANEEESTPDRFYCFMCRFSQSTSDGANKYFTDMVEFMHTQYHNMEPLEYLKEIQEMYNEHLRPHLKVPEEEKLPWYKSMIYTHLSQHAPTPHFIIERNVKRMVTITDELCNNGVYLRDKKSGKTMIDTRSLNSLMASMKYTDILLHKAQGMRPTTHI